MTQKEPAPDEVFALTARCPRCASPVGRWCCFGRFIGVARKFSGRLHSDRIKVARRNLKRAEEEAALPPSTDFPEDPS